MASGKIKRLFWCGLFVLLLRVPVQADDSYQVQFVEAYAGPHQAEFSDLLSQVKIIVPQALAYITQQWGLPNELHYPLVVRIQDVPNPDPTRALAAYVQSFRTGDKLRQQLVIDLTHHLMYPSENLDNLLYHEMAHAVLQDAVTTPVAVGIPQWFNEGLAQSVTTEGHDRTAEAFKLYGHSDAHAVICDLNGNIDTFYHGEYNFGCYTYFYLTVQRLIQLGGKDAVRKVVNALHDGTPLPNVIMSITGMNWNAFQQDAARYTQDVFAGRKPIP